MLLEIARRDRMSNRCRKLAFVLAAGVAVLALSPPSSSQVTGDAEEVIIYRDEFGVPHIFASTEEGAVYGMGYAQAEDRLEELLKQYRRAEGTMAEAFGSSYLQHDYRQR